MKELRKFKNIIKMLIIGLGGIFFACEQEEMDLIEDEVNANVAQDTTYTDAELLTILEEELKYMQDEQAGRIVDISGMDIVKENPKKVYVHYMPWFQSKEHDGYWGQHWTMTNQDPGTIDENGRRQIASYYYPLIGPYSSCDPDLQEYHFLMMKFAGIDGVIFDWYGSRDLYDYSIIKKSTETFIERMEELGLSFSIMYEDRVAVQAADHGLAVNAIEAAKEDFSYINEQYFSSPEYLHYEGKPILFVFGPHHLVTEAEWDQVFSVLPAINRPSFLTLWAASDRVGPNSAGEFLWVDKDHLLAHEYYYSVYPQQNAITVGGAYPGFKSFYADGGWSDGINEWTIDTGNGQTFVETLNYTHHEVADFIQLITWNDFGEGTMIEPTEEFGFMYLQLLQQYTGVSFTPNDLQVVLDLYFARKDYQDNALAQSLLDRSYKHLKRLNVKRARKVLEAVNRFY